MCYNYLPVAGSYILWYSKKMKLYFVTLFPSMFDGPMNASMLWKAQNNGLVKVQYINLRDFGLGQRKTVDDTPYGGGDGMLLKPEPLVAAIEYARDLANQNVDGTAGHRTKVILLTPRGKLYKQAAARRFAKCDSLIFVCARYEGYDERVTEYVDEQVSIGQFVLTGGELPAMVVADSVIRLIPGVLGGEQSAEIESFSKGNTLEFPQYTRPVDFRGQKVPQVLLSGNHAQITKWREENR